jgi:hypothetical protein
VRAARPLRGPEPEGGGFAAAHLRAAALWPGDAPRKGTGPPAPPASRLLRTAARRPAAGPDPGDLYGPSGRKYGQAQPAPSQDAARPAVHARYATNTRKRSEQVFDSQKKRRNYLNRL